MLTHSMDEVGVLLGCDNKSAHVTSNSSATSATPTTSTHSSSGHTATAIEMMYGDVMTLSNDEVISNPND